MAHTEWLLSCVVWCSEAGNPHWCFEWVDCCTRSQPVPGVATMSWQVVRWKLVSAKAANPAKGGPWLGLTRRGKSALLGLWFHDCYAGGFGSHMQFQLVTHFEFCSILECSFHWVLIQNFASTPQGKGYQKEWLVSFDIGRWVRNIEIGRTRQLAQYTTGDSFESSNYSPP